MGRRKDDEAIAKYEMYQQGLSLEEVAIKFNCTRQSVFELLKARGYQLRSLKKLEFIEFDGKKYTKRNDGYYRCTNGKRNLLHNDVWVFHNGEIPKGYDIHHIDKDLSNNDISNLELMHKSKHGKLHSVEGHNKRWRKTNE